MPRSNSSRISLSNDPLIDRAARAAKEFADREIFSRLSNGFLNRHDEKTIKQEYLTIYHEKYREYYLYSLDLPCRTRIVDNPAAEKYHEIHIRGGFTRLNRFVEQKQTGNCVRICVRPVAHVLDVATTSPEIREASLDTWPGPLDRPLNLKNKLIDYVENLLQNDSIRLLRYAGKDEQRETILKLLLKLLTRDGKIDDASITKLLLKPEQIDIKHDEGSLSTVTKYLLLGRRDEAIRFAKSRYLWDHAYCLFLLDEDNWTNPDKKQLIEEHIASIKDETLNMLYQSLLARGNQSKPSKPQKVLNDVYKFAILSANDCQVTFDESNEIFKLITAIKSAYYSHLICLGFQSLQEPGYDTGENISLRSNLSYNLYDTQTSRSISNNHHYRTLAISTIDSLILNEIWEYCLNLAQGTCDNENYLFNINLVPYKLVFASKLLDYGRHEMFENYLESIRKALCHGLYSNNKDSFYDWDTIVQSVELLGLIKDRYNHIPQQRHQQQPEEQHQHQPQLQHEPQPSPLQYNQETSFSQHWAPQVPQPMNIPQHFIAQKPIEEEPMDTHLEEEPQFPPMNNQDNSNEVSRRPSASQTMPFYASPPSYDPPGPSMTTSSPMSNNRDSLSMSEPLNPFSPINESDNIVQEDFDTNRRESFAPNNNQPHSTNSNDVNTSTNQSGQNSQQAGIFNKVASLLMSKSRSEIHLPPDNEESKNIRFDEAKQMWVDKSEPESAENGGFPEPPPVMNVQQPRQYSLKNKTVRSRYPQP